jgi:hypothetical protein
MIEDTNLNFESTEIPDEKIAFVPEPKRTGKPWLSSTIPDSFMAESGDEVFSQKNQPSESLQLEKQSNPLKLYNPQLEELQKLILEGISPTDAFKKLGIPFDPVIRKTLLAKILIDTAGSGDFPIELKKAVLEAETFRMFVDAAKRGDDKAANQWAKTLMSDPTMGKNRKEVTVEVSRNALDKILNEPDKVEILE